jgi:hypothetical protein
LENQWDISAFTTSRGTYETSWGAYNTSRGRSITFWGNEACFCAGLLIRRI